MDRPSGCGTPGDHGGPALLFLDEPTVGMDVEIRRAFWASMRDFVAGGRTVLFATHYLDEADTEADRIVVLARGRLVADGTSSMIKSRVADRTITLAHRNVTVSELSGLPGVISAERSGRRLLLRPPTPTSPCEPWSPSTPELPTSRSSPRFSRTPSSP